MKAKDLKQLSKTELETRAATQRDTIRDLRFKVTTRQHAKVRTLRTEKKDLARTLTVLSQLSKTV